MAIPGLNNPEKAEDRWREMDYRYRDFKRESVLSNKLEDGMGLIWIVP